MASHHGVLGEISVDTNAQNIENNPDILKCSIKSDETKKRKYESSNEDLSCSKTSMNKNNQENLVNQNENNVHLSNLNNINEDNKKSADFNEISLLTTESEVKNLKSDRNSVRRRRSSFGKCLSNPDREFLTNQSTAESAVHVDSESNAEKLSKTLSSIAEQEKKIDEQTLLRINKYKEKTQQLERERAAWTKEVKARNADLITAKREYADAKSGCVCLDEEDSMHLLSAEQKTFLMAKPDYQQYIQQVQRAREKLVLVSKRETNTMAIYSMYLDALEDIADEYFKEQEEKFLGDLKLTHPKDLMKDMQDLFCPDNLRLSEDVLELLH